MGAAEVIVDSSALIAILREEPDAPAHAAALAGPSSALMAAPTLLEASIVARELRDRLDELVAKTDIEVVDFTREHALVAREAYARYGKKSGSKAQLNFGDCMAYAVAKVRDEPLLFQGDDFIHTDVESALGAE